MAKIDSALETLIKLQSAAPPMTAQKLSEVIDMMKKLQDENELYYTRMVEAETHASSMVVPPAPSVRPVIKPLTGLFDDLATGVLKMPAAPSHPDGGDGEEVDFDTVFAQILATRPQFDTNGLPLNDAAHALEPPKAEAAPAPAADGSNVTGVLPKRNSTDISLDNAPNADSLLQRLPLLMRPVLAYIREQSADAPRLRPYADSAFKMIDSIEELHDMRRGLFALKPFAFSPRDLLRQARKELLPRAAAVDHQIVILAEDDLPQLNTDGERAYTILCDLLDNAIRYTPPSGTIRLTADSLGDQVLFTVSDSGIGLTEDDLQQVGTPFWRATHQPMVSKQPGAGLRVFIARRLLQLMGGELFISGEPGMGSSFSFTLPSPPAKDAAPR